MSPQEEREAEAFTVWRQHGERAPQFVAERVGSLAMVDDLDGVKRWQEIARALDGLMHGDRH